MALISVSRAYRAVAWCSACLGLAGAAAAAAALPTAAASQAMHFDIPAQPLESALVAYTRATGLSVLVQSGLTEGKQAGPVKGWHAPAEALAQLLAGTGLRVRYSSASAFTLVAPAAGRQAAPRTQEGAPGAGLLRAYAGVVQATLMRSLCHWQPEQVGRYRAGLEMWIDRAGGIGRVRLLASTGDAERDRNLVSRLRGLVMDRPPPPGLPQPLTIVLAPVSDPSTACLPKSAL